MLMVSRERVQHESGAPSPDLLHTIGMSENDLFRAITNLTALAIREDARPLLTRADLEMCRDQLNRILKQLPEQAAE